MINSTNLTNQPASPQPGREESIIPALSGSVTALCVNTFLAILAALALRLLFVWRFPGSADDSAVYIELARNWVDHHLYGLTLNGQIAPTDLRTPGYPAFLAGVALLFGRSIEAILLSQAFLDVLTCTLTAALATALAPAGSRRRVWIIALWLAATCPFLANYTAVVLTETLVTFLATAAFCCFATGLDRGLEMQDLHLWDGKSHPSSFFWALLGAFLTGLAALVRPEMPLLFGVAAIVYVLRGAASNGIRKAALMGAALVGAFLVPLVPWAVRNAVTLKEFQLLGPRYVVLPGEYAPIGFYAWTGTWLERYRDIYYTLWKLGEPDQPLLVDELPATAFDSPEEKARIARLFSQYNDSSDLEISPEEDREFARIAQERTRRHPLRTYLRVPFERALTIWFTPRTELLDVDGKFWPLRQQWRDSHVNVLVTGGFALLGYLYVGLAGMGVWRAWRAKRAASAGGLPCGPNVWAIALVIAYLCVRTLFLTTIEAPEPRYVVSCYPEAIALAALIGLVGIRKAGIRNGKHEETL